MSTSDSTVTYSQIDISLALLDGGSNSVTVGLVQADISWTIEGAPYTEARVRNQHAATPVVRKTGDGNVTGSLSALVSTFRAATATSPSLYEILTHTGSAASWATTAAGDRKTLKAQMTLNASSAGGASQRVDFNYMIFSNVKVDPAGAEGLCMISADFIDLENAPTIT